VPSPCKLEVIFSGADVLTSEGLSETFHLNSVPDLDTAIAIANNYAEWRRTYMAQGTFISLLRASLIQTPVISYSKTVLMEGNCPGIGGDGTRDLLQAGYLFRCTSLDRQYKGDRVFRAFPDSTIKYTAAGQEAATGFFSAFADALISKTTTLGLALNSISKDPVISKPKVISAIAVAAGRMTGVTAVGAGAEAGYAVGERITITGQKGTGGSAVNGVYRIAEKNADVLTLFPQPTVPPGFTPVLGTGRTSLRIASYPTIARADLVRFGKRDIGKKASGQRGRSKNRV